jgi:hypothetical protein
LIKGGFMIKKIRDTGWFALNTEYGIQFRIGHRIIIEDGLIQGIEYIDPGVVTQGIPGRKTAPDDAVPY